MISFPVAGCFNTQPPEGGWPANLHNPAKDKRFNTQPPEGGWLFVEKNDELTILVSTHSRPKAAGAKQPIDGLMFDVSTHSRPKAAGGVSLK